MMKNIKYKFWK